MLVVILILIPAQITLTKEAQNNTETGIFAKKT